MTQLFEQTGALLFLIGWGFAVGGLIVYKGAKQAETMVTLAKMAERQEGGQAGPAAFKSALLAYLATSLAFVVAAYAWLPGVLVSFLFGIGKETIGYAPLQVVVCASFFPLAAGAVYQRRWRRRYRAEQTAHCPQCGRLNDRPHFPGHHRYQVVCSYASRIAA
jgi:hypothetical protein